jgi:hypothetical protein
MLAREHNYILKWETHEAKGKWTYMVLTSLVWGILLSLLFFLFKLAAHGDLNLTGLRATLREGHYLLVWLLSTLLVLFKSLLFWRLARNKYRSLKRKQEQEWSERRLSQPAD